ncbi:MAG: IclR family transcriptional regulator [Pseudomonadota bacterium]
MSTIAKALKLLEFFNTNTPELGLTQFTKLSGYDKASTHRRLTELVETGFLEQDSVRKTYRLGAAIPRLALVREQTFPAAEAAKQRIQTLYEKVTETVHVSIVQGSKGLSTLAHIDDKIHGNRVYIEPADILPFHATASGLVVLAFSDEPFRNTILSQTLDAITDETVTDTRSLADYFEQIRTQGFCRSDGGYEADVTGISVPVFDVTGNCAGAIAVAAPKSRVTEMKETEIVHELIIASSRLSSDWGGEIPDSLLKIWK